MTDQTIPGLVLHERVYRFCLFVLPRSFRAECSEEILETFRDEYRDRFWRSGPRGARRFARKAAVQLLVCAVRLRMPYKARIQSRATTKSSLFFLNTMRDIRVAIRGFVHKPGFFFTATMTMALGIGATTAVFSVVDKVLLRPLPYPEANRLVYFTNASHSVPDFKDWRDRTDSFESLAGSRVINYDLLADGTPKRIRTALVTADFFKLFGARTTTGMFFGHDDVNTGSQPVVVSHALWQTQWGSDPQLVGANLTINGAPAVVIGIMDPGFQLPEIMVGGAIDVWMPLDETAAEYDNRGTFILRVTAKIQSGRTIEVAQSELNVLAEALAAEYPDRYRRPDGTARAETIVPLFAAMTSEVSSTLRMLMGAVGLMLLIACANVANLFLARGNDRRREITLRVALGAARGRIVRQLLVESVVLSLVGGTLGVMFALAGVTTFARLSPGGVPRLETVSVDGRVLLFTLAISIMTGVLFGVVPAVQGARSNANEILKEATGRATVGRGGQRVREGLVVAEIAMSLILTAGAAVLFHSLVTSQRTDPGIAREHVITVPLALNSLEAEARATFSNALLERFASHPIIEAVGAGVTVPFAVLGGGRCCWFMDFSRVTTPDALEAAVVHPITPGYFTALGATIMRGRDFTDRDQFVEPIPAILNAAFARRLFGDENPIGRALVMNGSQVTIVGIVNDIRHWGLQEPIENEAYFPYAGAGEGFFRYYLVLRTDAPLEVASDIIRSTIWSVKPDLPVETIAPMAERVSQSIADARFYSLLLAVFASVSLVLAAAGIYGSMLYSVGQRYRELGVRLAVGARPRDITRLILVHGSKITGVGVVVGVAGAYALVQMLEHLIVGVSPSDIRTMSASAVLLALVALAACWIPARRASTTDPNQILRFE